MTERTTPDLIFANVNLAQSPGLLVPPSWIGAYARGAGFDGVEMTPLLPYVYSPEAVGRAAARGELELVAQQQSFRTDTVSRDTNRPGGNEGAVARLIDGTVGRILLPEMVASGAYLDRVQWALGRRLPAILHPQDDAVRDRRAMDLAQASETTFQPTDHVARLVGARTLEEFEAIMFGERGYDAFCLDLFHARRRYGAGSPGLISSTSRSFGRMVSRATEVQVSVGRLDLIDGEEHIPTEQELHDVLDGEIRGELGAMLTAVKEAGVVRRLTLELSSRRLAAAVGYRGLAELQLGKLRDKYRQIADNLRGFMAA